MIDGGRLADVATQKAGKGKKKENEKVITHTHKLL